MRQHEERAGFVLAIGVFKLLKALLLVAAGLGALKLLHGGASEFLERVQEAMPMAPGRAFLERAAARIGGLSQKQLEGIAFGTFVRARMPDRSSRQRPALISRASWTRLREIAWFSAA